MTIPAHVDAEARAGYGVALAAGPILCGICGTAFTLDIEDGGTEDDSTEDDGVSGEGGGPETEDE